VISQQHIKQVRSNKGFSLVELMVAGLVSLLTAYTAGDLLLSYIQSAERAESLEQQRENWARAASFIEADIALSEKIYKLQGTTNQLSIPEECDALNATDKSNKIESPNDMRLGLDQGKLITPVIYYVKPSIDGWLDDYTLYRCGPAFDLHGRAIQGSVEIATIADGLDGTEDTAYGFDVSEPNNGKEVSFTLSLRGHALNKVFIQEDATQARISPLFVRPTEYSYCSGNAFVKVEGSAAQETLAISIGQVSAGEDILICGRGGGDTITGSDEANDILEAGDTGGSNVSGLGGNDRLRGTNDEDHPDVLNGGDDDDVLVGRGGFDLLNGGCGVNQYLPGTGIDTVNGDGSEYKYSYLSVYDPATTDQAPVTELVGTASTCSPYDIVFFPEPIASYAFSSPCNNVSCTVTALDNSSKDSLNKVEVLIFKDARKDLLAP